MCSTVYVFHSRLRAQLLGGFEGDHPRGPPGDQGGDKAEGSRIAEGGDRGRGEDPPRGEFS